MPNDKHIRVTNVSGGSKTLSCVPPLGVELGENESVPIYPNEVHRESDVEGLRSIFEDDDFRVEFVPMADPSGSAAQPVTYEIDVADETASGVVGTFFDSDVPSPRKYRIIAAEFHAGEAGDNEGDLNIRVDDTNEITIDSADIQGAEAGDILQATNIPVDLEIDEDNTVDAEAGSNGCPDGIVRLTVIPVA